MNANFKELEGKEFIKVERINDDEIRFYLTDDIYYSMYHEDDCCESVTIEDICGDLEDLVNTRIFYAEEVTNSDKDPEGYPEREYELESFTWTFYTIRSMEGTVTIRWLGESNGYYSESVDMKLIIPAAIL